MGASRRQETKAAEEGFQKIKGFPCCLSDGIACKYTLYKYAPWNARWLYKSKYSVQSTEYPYVYIP